MRKYRPVITALTALLFYTIADILVWQRIFEANNMVEHADTYHIGWFVSLAGYATIGLLLMWGEWKDCFFFLISLFVGAFCGLEDVLYYFLDRKPMPQSLPWLDANPMIYHASREGVLLSVFFWLTGLVILYVWLYWRRSEQPQSMQVTFDGKSSTS